MIIIICVVTCPSATRLKGSKLYERGGPDSRACKLRAAGRSGIGVEPWGGI